MAPILSNGVEPVGLELINIYSSGRYILIKLWSPHDGGNIDIQSIIAHGYAGPRYFPAGGFR